MNKKGVGIVGAVILFLIFIINWFVWLGSWISEAGALAIAKNNFTGFEAFFFNNLNFAVLICMILGIIGWTYFSGE